MFERKYITKDEAKKHWPDKHNQPERSKREDFYGSKAIMMPDGKCYFEDGIIVDSKQPIEDAVL